MFKGEDELTESSSLPPGWMAGMRFLNTGRKIPSFISQDRVLSFRSKVSVFEYVRVCGGVCESVCREVCSGRCE